MIETFLEAAQGNMWRTGWVCELAVRTEVGATRLPRYAKWLQLERRLVSEVVGVGCLIHIPSVSLDVLLASLKFFVEEDILLMNRRWRGNGLVLQR
jgi:hypothetical protein